MQIKTICVVLDEKWAFDDAVNKALAEGWVLTKRDVLQPRTERERTTVYAELILPDAPAEPEPIDVMEAMRIVKEECDCAFSCDECRLHDICKHRTPSLWEEIPE